MGWNINPQTTTTRWVDMLKNVNINKLKQVRNMEYLFPYTCGLYGTIETIIIKTIPLTVLI